MEDDFIVNTTRLLLLGDPEQGKTTLVSISQDYFYWEIQNQGRRL